MSVPMNNMYVVTDMRKVRLKENKGHEIDVLIDHQGVGRSVVADHCPQVGDSDIVVHEEDRGVNRTRRCRCTNITPEDVFILQVM